MDNLNLTDNVNTLFQSLESFTQHEGVIGKPVSQSQKTFMPIVSVTVGYGGGNAAMKGKTGSSSSSSTSDSNTSSSTGTGALGLGAKLNTEAVIVINDQNQDVSILPMNSAGVGPIMDKIPQILTGMTQNKQGQSGQSNQSGQSK